MITEIVSRLRDGLASKRFTMKQISDLTGVPVSTIADMKKEGWQKTTFDNLSKIEAALSRLEPGEEEQGAPEAVQP